MCGIVGYIGYDNAKRIIIKRFRKKLEYRGYDSAGIAVVMMIIQLYSKKKVVLRELRKVADSSDFDGPVGIGHTRWATHGVPNHETLIHINHQMAVLL